MSQVAGRMSIQAGAHCLEKPRGGSGILLGGVPGVAAANVVVIGGGVGLAPGYADRLRGHLATMADQFRPHLKTAVLGRHAGVIGAADLAVSIHPNTPNRQEKS